MIQKATAMDKWWLAASSQKHTHSCITSHAEFLVKHQITRVTQPPYCPDLARCDFWFFPKQKSSLKRKRFQTTDEIQENMMWQLMVIGRTVWGPKVLNLKGIEASLFYVQCFNKCLYFSYCMAGYVLDRPCMYIISRCLWVRSLGTAKVLQGCHQGVGQSAFLYGA